MGRPLNKRNFGAAGVGPTAGGSEIKVNFHNGTAVKEGYIVKQKSSTKFVCEEIGTTGEFTCTLTTGKLPSALRKTRSDQVESDKADRNIDAGGCYECRQVAGLLQKVRRKNRV